VNPLVPIRRNALRLLRPTPIVVWQTDTRVLPTAQKALSEMERRNMKCGDMKCGNI
jgi:hypothetical protein